MSFATLIEAAGQRLGAPLALDHAGLARLVVDGRHTIDFELEDGGETLFVSGVLGPLPPDGREALYADLLAASLFGTRTGGFQAALDPVRRELLLWEAHRSAPEVEVFVARLEALAAQLEDWKQRLGSAGTQRAQPLVASMPMGAMLRA